MSNRVRVEVNKSTNPNRVEVIGYIDGVNHYSISSSDTSQTNQNKLEEKVLKIVTALAEGTSPGGAQYLVE